MHHLGKKRWCKVKQEMAATRKARYVLGAIGFLLLGSGAMLLLGTDGCGTSNEGPVDVEGLWLSTGEPPECDALLDPHWILMVRSRSVKEARRLLQDSSSIPLDLDTARQFAGTIPIVSEERRAFLVRCVQVSGIQNEVTVRLADSGAAICVSTTVWGERHLKKFRNWPVVVFLKKEPKEVRVEAGVIYGEIPITEEIGYWEYRILIIKRVFMRALTRVLEEPAKVGTFLIAICCPLIAVYLFWKGMRKADEQA